MKNVRGVTVIKYCSQKRSVQLAWRLIDSIGYLAYARRAPRGEAVLPGRITFVMPDRIGEVIMALPTVTAVCAMTPHAQVSFLTAPAPGELLKEYLPRAEVRSMGPPGEQGTLTKQKKLITHHLQELSPDVILVFRANLPLNFFVGMSTARSFGFTNAGGGFRLTNPISMQCHRHLVEENYTLAAAYSRVYGTDLPALESPSFALKEEWSADIKSFCKKRSIDPARLAIVHAVPTTVSRQWIPDSWRTVVAWLEEKKYHVATIGAPGDFARSAGLEKTLDFCGLFSLPQTAALLAESRLCIAIDSGPAHLAAAVGCPVVSIFSQNDPRRMAPYDTFGNTTVLCGDPSTILPTAVITAVASFLETS